MFPPNRLLFGHIYIYSSIALILPHVSYLPCLLYIGAQVSEELD